MACKSQAGFEPGTQATVFSTWTWDISGVFGHLATTAGSLNSSCFFATAAAWMETGHIFCYYCCLITNLVFPSVVL